MKLFGIYSELAQSRPGGLSDLWAAPVSGSPIAYVALDASHCPHLLFRFTSDSAVIRKDIYLESIDVQFGRKTRISQNNSSESDEGVFTVVALREFEYFSVKLFLQLFADFSDRYPRCSDIEIGAFVTRIAELFSSPSDRAADVIGLWGELFFILSSPFGISQTAKAWTVKIDSKFDFVFENSVFEIKTTERAERVHRFSLSQVQSAPVDTIVASLRISAVPGGWSLLDQFNRINQEIRDKGLRGEFQDKVLLRLGKSLLDDQRSFYPLDESPFFRYLFCNKIPRPRVSMGDPITDVRFSVCLDDICATSFEQMRLSNQKIG